MATFVWGRYARCYVSRRDFIKGIAALAANSFSSTFSWGDPTRFASNHNEIIWSPISGGHKCNPITDLIVQINVEQDIVVPSEIAFQLNCFTPLDKWQASASLPQWHSVMAFQQYVIGYDPVHWNPPNIGCSIDTFPAPWARKVLSIREGSPANPKFQLIQAPGYLGGLSGRRPNQEPMPPTSSQKPHQQGLLPPALY